MSYLLQPGTPTRTSNKWGMGDLRKRARAIRRTPIQSAVARTNHYGAKSSAHGGSIASSVTKWRMGSLGLNPTRLRGLGDDFSVIPSDNTAVTDSFTSSTTGLPYSDFSSALGPANLNPYSDPSGGYVTGNTPAYSQAQNPNPVTGGASNGGITTAPAGTPSQDPLDYVSPQAAIAAGLNSTTVYAAWSSGVSKYPSPQAAVNAGIPAGVVNQLWQAIAPTPAAGSSATFFGLSLTTIAIGAAALFVLPSLMGRKGRR